MRGWRRTACAVATPTVWRDTVSVNRNGRRRLPAFWRGLRLWPRLAIGATAGFLILFLGFSALALRAVDASTNRILHERLAITEELADDFDGLLEHRFADLVAFDARPAPPEVQRRLLAEVYRASGGAFTSVSLLDRNGRTLEAFGPSASSATEHLTRTGYVGRALRTGTRAISPAFRDGRGRPIVALGVPVRVRGGRGLLIGTLDLAGQDVVGRLGAARSLGRTGHAELVGPAGIALASTEGGAALVPGEHLAFYRTMLRTSQPAVADVSTAPSAQEPAELQHARHVMAFVQLTAAPWAVALGGTTDETYAPARHLRRTLILGGGGALAALWLLTLLGARLLVHPVRGLTRAAEEMASGDLERSVHVSEGGEIGVLAESLETMRVQLKGSLDTVRRWGEDLELTVADRTAELNARNRQLAAVSAILAVANRAHDLDDLLSGCLDVALEQTGADAAAIRVVDEGDSEPTEAVAHGTWTAFPCRDCTDRFPESGDARPVYLDAQQREHGHPGCLLGDGAISFLPLQGRSGYIGSLTLGRRDGVVPGEDERPILTAIADQIAVAVENARLAAELRRLEAQHEVQRMRSELISAVSHELRTPLGFIKSYATTLLREDAPIDDATRRRFLGIVDEETDKLEHMIGELLDAGRLQAGRLPIEPEPILLDALVAHAVEKAEPSLRAQGHRVAVRLPGHEVHVLADPLRIEQVLDNLLENAGRYASPASPVDVALLAEGSHAIVTVTDRGDGLPADDLEPIFEPFYRGRNATSRRIRGAGLGLSISRGIVEAHGGRIWAETGEGRTTFLFTLPVAEITPGAVVHEGERPTAGLARRPQEDPPPEPSIVGDGPT